LQVLTTIVCEISHRENFITDKIEIRQFIILLKMLSSRGSASGNLSSL
jgi:hypothetical protein